MNETLNNGTVDEIVKKFMDEVNILCFNTKSFGEKLKSNPNMRDLAYYWIKELSDKNYPIDGRNEYSANVGKKLITYSFIQDEITKLNNHRMEEVAKKMIKEHKTLQQSFSSVAFYVIAIKLTKKQMEELSKDLYEDFYITPMI